MVKTTQENLGQESRQLQGGGGGKLPPVWALWEKSKSHKMKKKNNNNNNNKKKIFFIENGRTRGDFQPPEGIGETFSHLFDTWAGALHPYEHLIIVIL